MTVIQKIQEIALQYHVQDCSGNVTLFITLYKLEMNSSNKYYT